MITRTLTSHTIQTSDYSDDLGALRRLLTAAAISSRFRTSLLENPGLTVQQGFGGEFFPLSDSTLNLVSLIQASTLGEFIQCMNENFPIL